MNALLLFAVLGADPSDSDARAALALASAAVPKRACACSSPADCVCVGACPCANCAAHHEYRWVRFDDDDSQIALTDHGRQVGGWSYSGQFFRPVSGGVWGERCSAPCDVPPRVAPETAPTLRAAPGPLFLPPFAGGPPGAFGGGSGGCVGSSCGSNGVGAGRRR